MCTYIYIPLVTLERGQSLNRRYTRFLEIILATYAHRKFATIETRPPHLPAASLERELIRRVLES